MNYEFSFIGKSLKSIHDKLDFLGATNKTIEQYFKGNYIITCPKCDTYNLCEVESFEKTINFLKKKGVNFEKYGDEFDLFYCNKCKDYAVRYKN